MHYHFAEHRLRLTGEIDEIASTNFKPPAQKVPAKSKHVNVSTSEASKYTLDASISLAQN